MHLAVAPSPIQAGRRVSCLSAEFFGVGIHLIHAPFAFLSEFVTKSAGGFL